MLSISQCLLMGFVYLQMYRTCNTNCLPSTELMIADRRQKREIRHVEQELPKWQVLVDSVTG
jgi:hypothetical protein